MAKASGTRKQTKQAPEVRVGRPPREFAGEVEDRILDAARSVFLAHGLGGASIDEVARLARAGKPTIYARYGSKEALFGAVVMRDAARTREGFANRETDGETIEERLISVATNLLKGLLAKDTIDFIRLSLAEVKRFPELANFGRSARDRGVGAVVHVLNELAGTIDLSVYPAFTPDRVAKTTEHFLDLAVERLFLRALLGENPKQLRAAIDSHVKSGVAFFLAACRDPRRT